LPFRVLAVKVPRVTIFFPFPANIHLSDFVSGYFCCFREPMIKEFKKLTDKEVELLLKAPVLVSVLASTRDHEISNEEKADAIKLAHLKTFTADPLLLQYYNEVEKNFKMYFEEITKEYSPFDDTKRAALKEQIDRLNEVISKLDKKFGRTLHRSLTNYAEHVKRSDRTIFENFIFPFPVHDLTH
jgi:hypothetical protein